MSGLFSDWFVDKDAREEIESLRHEFETFQYEVIDNFEHMDICVSSIENKIDNLESKLSDNEDAMENVSSIKKNISALKYRLSKIESQFDFTGAVEVNTLEESRIIIMIKDPVHGDRVEIFRFRGCENYLRFLLDELKEMHKNGMSIGFVDAPKIAEDEIRDIFHRGLKEKNEGE